MATKPINATMSDFDVRSMHELAANEPEIMPEDDALLNVLADLEGDESNAEVKAYRVDPNAKNTKGGAYLFTCSPAEFTLDRLRDEYEGGMFRIHVRANGSLLSNKLITVEPPKREKIAQNIDPVGMLAMVEKMIEKNNEQMKQLFFQTQQTRQIDPFEMQEKFLTQMIQMKTLFGNEGAKSSGGELMSFLKGVEFAKEINAPEKEESTGNVIMEAIKTFGAPLAAMVQQGQTQQAPAPQISQTRPAQLPPPLSEIERQMFLTVVPASKDADPEVYAQVFVDTFEHSDVMNLFTPSDFVEKMAAKNPVFLKYKDWFQEMKNIIMEIYEIEKAEEINNANSDAESEAEMRTYIATLCEGAIANEDTKYYAEVTVKNMPRFMLNNIMENNPIEFMQSRDSRVKTHLPWFNQYITDIKTLLTNEN